MRKIVTILFVTALMMGAHAIAEEDVFISIGDYNDTVISLHQKLSELGYYCLRAESPWGSPSVAALKILQENMGWEETGVVESQEQYYEIQNMDHVIGKNLVIETSEVWSEWYSPEDKNNWITNPFYVLLGNDKHVGDQYTCSIEVEFKGVSGNSGGDQPFCFRTQGAVDGAWDLGNIWDGKIIRLSDVPTDGVYSYTATNSITEKNVKNERFNLGFRCDYWKSGSFRIRKVKVEKGAVATEWVAYVSGE